MMKLKHLVMAAAVATLAIGLAACGKNTKNGSGQAKVGILQLIDQSALDAARKGFEQELSKEGYKTGKNLTINYVNAQGDQSNLSTMSQRLAGQGNDVNLAIATPAAQALQKADPKTPLLFTAITDPKSAGLVNNLNQPDKGATGVTDMVDVNGQLKLLQQLFPKAKRIGLVFNAAEPNSVFQIKLARKYLKAHNLTAVEKTVATTNDVQQVMTSMKGKVDAIYMPADNVLTAAMATVGKVSEQIKVPVIPATGPMVQLGGVATNGIDYKDLGVQTAKMAVKILKGKKVNEMAVEKPAKTKIIVNDKLAKVFNVDVKAAVK
ncbi:ATP-binding cassette transporter [Lacticaseibacillus brantae DSM 23927]|uniref:ATP-binding cassette transporter n=2 Tax=Lacticaseibacillus brantae TaxID=943673 RepID=A0A0R2AYS4_9LACO|nr:ATP-binding cassette transporter [Lacticaseibacillus brantae DSM 23927]